MAKRKVTVTETTPAAGPQPGDQVRYVVIEQPGAPETTWPAEITAVHDGGLVDLAVSNQHGYEGVAFSVSYGRDLGCWHES